MKAEFWYLLLGGMLVAIALLAWVLRRLPLTSTMLYLGVGIGLGPIGAGIIQINPLDQHAFLERLTELGVIVSLFTAGLKLRVPLRLKLWAIPLRLAFFSMVITVGLIALVGVWGLGLSLGAAVLLGAVLAPTDPVLASEVQLGSPHDRDRLRFSITGEAGFNDGTAFPFVMLGLGLLGLHELGRGAWRWVAVDVVWALVAGLAIGGIFGRIIAQLVLQLRRKYGEGPGRDEFLALGLIGVSYGTALLVHSYGFLAVFAAGLAVRTVERQQTKNPPPPTPTRNGSEASSDEAPAEMADAVLTFNEQFERLLEVALVLVVGTMLTVESFARAEIWFIPVLLLVVRPLAVLIGLAGVRMPRRERAFISWFGIRGIGSLYYLMYALSHGVPRDIGQVLVNLTLSVVAASVVLHGISVSPLMNWYERKRSR